MLSLFGKALRKNRAAQEPAEQPALAPIAPEGPFAVIGDVHGCGTLMLDLLSQIDALSSDLPVVFVGDLIDRGPQSASVLAAIHAEATVEGARVFSVLGNHESMFLAFIDDPARHGSAWLSHGGLQMIESLGLRGLTMTGGAPAMVALRDQVRDAIDPAVIDWLRDLPLWWQSGNVVAVHAGADPRLPLEEQSEQDLIWGNRHWPDQARGDGLWIVHGHTIRPECEIIRDRICIDTGAYATGVLSAAVFGLDERPRFLSAYSRK
ncbi:metallophosphoesterase [Xinfangfangia pollutisoli]|uniref:metallophosphoesterase n=1 Tax=Xinfangfangia pollutisoli TaxID=2865960 RepID=UPI001CD4B534|nr:metallophosphoesterase [Xinfangfangia pollutisoli]